MLTGATASGKSSLAIELAEHLGCEIISADSRQIYTGMPIGTAAPSAQDLARVPHHMVGILPPDAYYSAAKFEEDTLALLPRLWEKCEYAILCGGSMMYVDAVTDGIDPLPAISTEVRERVKSLLAAHGPEGLFALLSNLDPEYAEEVDPDNIKRIAHAVEISIQAGQPYSQLLTGSKAERPWRIIKVALNWPREQLFSRINSRVDAMIAAGLEDEARRLLPLRHLNALNTVGYKEMFAYFDGEMDLPTAIARIAKNTRVYAKKQLTWLARPTVRPTIQLDPQRALQELLSIINSKE